MLRGLQDLLSQATQEMPKWAQDAQAGAPNTARGSRGGGSVSGNSGKGASKALQANALPFPDAWKAYCSTNPRLRDPRTLPALVRCGVPDNCRLEVWSHCLGLGDPGSRGPAILPTIRCPIVDDDQDIATCGIGDDSATTASDATENHSSEPPSSTVVEDAVVLSDDLATVIEADVNRTFQANPAFKQMGGRDRLRRVLRTFAVGDAELGYCQSMNFLAAVLLMVFQDESATLWGLRQMLLKLGTRCWYLDGMRQLRADTAVLEDLVQERLPKVHAAFRLHRFDLVFVCSKWFLCLFSTILEGEALRRIWDVILCDGIEAVFRISLALLARTADRVTSIRSSDDLVEMYQEFRLDCSAELLIQQAYGPALVGNVGRADLAQRRRQAADKISKDDTRRDMLTTHLRRGGVRPASILAR